MKSNVTEKNLIEIHLYDRYVYFKYYAVKKKLYTLNHYFKVDT